MTKNRAFARTVAMGGIQQILGDLLAFNDRVVGIRYLHLSAPYSKRLISFRLVRNLLVPFPLQLRAAGHFACLRVDPNYFAFLDKERYAHSETGL